MADMWGMPGAAEFVSAPTGAQIAAAAVIAQRQTAYGTPEQIRAQREQEARTLRERHVWMLANAADPIVRALIEAHHPRNDDLFPDCAECPEPASECSGDPEPTSWPCPVWEFINERMDEESS